MMMIEEPLRLACDTLSVRTAPWLKALRQKKLNQFLARGFPSKKEERWKYTDLAVIQDTFSSTLAPCSQALSITAASDLCHRLIFINGYFEKKLSTIHPLPAGVILTDLKTALKEQSAFIQGLLMREQDTKAYPFATLNTALMSNGLFLYVPENTVVKEPIHVCLIGSGAGMQHTRNIVVSKPYAQATWIEEFYSETDDIYFHNHVTDICLDANATFHFYRSQKMKNAYGILNTGVIQKENSQLKTFSLHHGGNRVRDNLCVHLEEKNAVCDLHGLYLTQGAQHLDQTIAIHHEAPSTSSDIDYTGILKDRSRAIYNGQVNVLPAAKKTRAHQINKNFLLSMHAEVNTKPELEIDTDDIDCTHGATVGQFDENTLFYLQSRGFSKEKAIALLADAFSEAFIDKMPDPRVADSFRKILLVEEIS